MTPKLEDLLRNAFGGMEQGPKPLKPAVAFYAQQGEVPVGDAERLIVARIAAGPNDAVRVLFNDQLKRWDWESTAPWTAGSDPNTRDRRVRIYELLRIE